MPRSYKYAFMDCNKKEATANQYQKNYVYNRKPMCGILIYHYNITKDEWEYLTKCPFWRTVDFWLNVIDTFFIKLFLDLINAQEYLWWHLKHKINFFRPQRLNLIKLVILKRTFIFKGINFEVFKAKILQILCFWFGCIYKDRLG